MPKPSTSVDLSDDVARCAEALVAAGRVGSIEDLVWVGIAALEEREQEWLEHARLRFQQGLEAEARGEAYRIEPGELMARLRARVEKAL